MLVNKFLKKIVIKICRICGYEIIDQNQFTFPSLKNNEYSDLSTVNQKSIVIPLALFQLVLTAPIPKTVKS